MPDLLAPFRYGVGSSAALENQLDVWVGLALSLLLAAFFLRARANQRKLPQLRLPDEGPSSETPSAKNTLADAPPDCMVVIPARNEAGFIGRAVSSLPHDSVIVVDDFSTDSTAQEAGKAGAGVIPAPKLSGSASGKSNACIAGARTITTKWILFTDADTHFAPGFLDATIGTAESSGVALLSVYLDPEYATVWERVIGPYLVALFFCGANPRADVANAFSGQCLLVRRDAYEFLGGHSAVLNDLTEDVRLAALAKRHRLKFGIVRANGLGRARFRDLRGMVQRGARRFMIGSPGLGLMILMAALLMSAWIPVFAWLLANDEGRLAAALVILPFLLLWRWYPRGSASAAALALPVAVYAALPMIGHGLVSALSGKTEWKGRRI